MFGWINEHLPGYWWFYWDLYWVLTGLLLIGIVAGLFQLTNRVIKNELIRQRLQTGIAAFMCLTSVSYCFVHHTKSMFCEYLLISGIAIFSIYKCEYLSFQMKEYLCILGLLMITTVHGYGLVIEEKTIIPLSVLITLFVKLTDHTLRSKWLSIWMCVLTICSHIWLFRKIYYLLFKDLNGYLAITLKSAIPIRVAFFILVGLFFLLLTLGLVYVERKYLRNWYEKISNISKIYAVIDRYFMAAIIFDCILMLIVNNSCRMNGLIQSGYETYFYNLMEWIGVFFIVLQFIFVALLTQVSEQKIRIRKQELQNENMMAYHKKLEENLMEIRAVKHDLKNVFLTMGEYVNRSNDEEMKAFYQEAICPLADKEIRMNDCFVALERIGNDQVKAFMFYKLSYGISKDIDMKLMISTADRKQVDIPRDWEFIETIVRILGIWLDNAIEECTAIQGEGNEVPAKCLIRIKQDEQHLQFQIENTVRQKVQLHGIEKGTTTKGLGRGNGLLYVDKMIKKYQNCVWNSYFKDGHFIQSMMFDLSKDIN